MADNHDDLRERAAAAALAVWNKHAIVCCDHTQAIPIGTLVDAVLAVRDNELETLRRLLAEKQAEVDDKSDVGHAVADAWQERAEQAEAAIARVLALAERWKHTSDRKGGPLSELLAALDGPAVSEEQTGGGNG